MQISINTKRLCQKSSSSLRKTSATITAEHLNITRTALTVMGGSVAAGLNDHSSRGTNINSE